LQAVVKSFTDSKGFHPPELLFPKGGSLLMLSAMSRLHKAGEWFIQGVIVLSLIVHLVDLHVVERRGHPLPWLHTVDYVIVSIFTVEYFVRWYYAPNRKKYPFTPLALLDLLVLLPFFMSHLLDLRSLRMIRMVRMLQLLKIYRHNRAMQTFLATIRRVLPQLGVVGVVVFMVVLMCSTAMYECERDVQPTKFRHLGDAVWWCVVTLSTVGYGDVYPETQAGRVVAAFTMMAGLGIFGTFISLVGSAFITAIQDEEQHSLTLSKPIYRQLRAVQRDLGELTDVDSLRQVADQAVTEYVIRVKAERHGIE
jgi:voltage-gated potassium channel